MQTYTFSEFLHFDEHISHVNPTGSFDRSQRWLLQNRTEQNSVGSAKKISDAESCWNWCLWTSLVSESCVHSCLLGQYGRVGIIYLQHGLEYMYGMSAIQRMVSHHANKHTRSECTDYLLKSHQMTSSSLIGQSCNNQGSLVS